MEQPENAFSYLRDTGESRNYFLGQTRDEGCGLCWGGRTPEKEQWLDSKDKRVRTKQKNDLLGDKDGGTSIMWSDWITVDRYCLKGSEHNGVCWPVPNTIQPGPARA